MTDYIKTWTFNELLEYQNYVKGRCDYYKNEMDEWSERYHEWTCRAYNDQMHHLQIITYEVFQVKSGLEENISKDLVDNILFDYLKDT
jgi:hypothetical protein